MKAFSSELCAGELTRHGIRKRVERKLFTGQNRAGEKFEVSNVNAKAQLYSRYRHLKAQTLTLVYTDPGVILPKIVCAHAEKVMLIQKK